MSAPVTAPPAQREAGRRARVELALRRLRDVETLDGVLDTLCPCAADATDLDWVLAGRVRDGVWSPWRLHDATAADTDPADRLHDTVIDLDQLPLESAAAARARPVTVLQARADPPMPQPLRRLWGGGAFVIAPIVIGGTVLGLLHGGRAGAPPPIDDADRDGLWRFAVGAGRIIARADLRRRLETHDALVAGACTIAARVTDANRRGIELERLVGQATAAHADDRDAVRGRRLAAHESLTPREREVLALVAQGHGNAEIAERLAVSRSTIKSHVRSVMRTLGVVSRTELIASSHRSRPGG